MNNKLSKSEIIQKIELLSEKAQQYLTDLLTHNLSHMPIEYKETTEIIELAACGLIKQAKTKEDFFEMNNSELEICLHYFGERIDSELTKNELIELIMQHKESFSEFYIPILTFGNKKAIATYLYKKFNWVLIEE